MKIHPTCVVSKEAQIAEDVEMGPFCIVRGKVKIGAGTKLDSHVSIGSETGITEIGKGNTICAGAALGGLPQDIHYKGEPTKLVIGDHNMIREYSSINIGTVKGGGETRIGDHNLIMAYVHIGHDCRVGNQNTIVNSTQIAGHVQIDHKVTIGGVCGINQFVRIGSYAFVAGYSAVNKDIIPYSIAGGNYAVARATNKIGLERSGLTAEVIEDLHRALRILIKGSSTIQDALVRIEAECRPGPEVLYLTDFVRNSKRGIGK